MLTTNMNNCLKLSDFEKICRICMLFINETDKIPLSNTADMIQECTSVQVANDDCMPQQLCQTCFQQLKTAYALKLLCEKSYTIFCKIIKEQKLKAEQDVVIKEENTSWLDNNSAEFDCAVSPIVEVKQEKSIYEDDSDDQALINKISSSRFVKQEKSIYKDDSDDSDDQVLINKISSSRLINKQRSLKRKRKRKKIHLKFECDKCNKSYSSVYTLRYHNCKTKVHCNQCNQYFSTPRKQELHKCKSMKDVKSPCLKLAVCETCGKSMKKRYLKKHIEIHLPKKTKFPCKLCTKTFLHNVSLLHHIGRVHENKPKIYTVLCNICGKGIESAAKLKTHLLIHTGEKPFTCEKCHKKYRRKDALQKHNERAHLDKRTHICSVCLRAFFDQRILKSHMTTHTGEKPHHCDICDRSFGQNASLWAHKKKSHSSV